MQSLPGGGIIRLYGSPTVRSVMPSGKQIFSPSALARRGSFLLFYQGASPLISYLLFELRKIKTIKFFSSDFFFKQQVILS